MRGANRVSADPRLRAVAGLLVCLLACTLSAATPSPGRKHLHHGVVAATWAVSDTPTAHARGDQPVAAAATPAAAALTAGAGRTADSSGSVSAPTARTPQVRGPPLEAAA